MTGQSILVVDDDNTNRLVVRLLLERRGFTLVEAASGFEAIALFAARDIDLVLMDISMPGLDGFETTRRLRSLGFRGRRTPIVALTGHAGRYERQACSAHGMNGFLEKPFDLTAAMRVISALLDTRVAGFV